jgi:GT2 family glycosyltransferase
VSAISVVIPNLNGASFLSRFLPDLLGALDRVEGNHQVVVVDNASRDESIALLKRDFPSVDVMALEENQGFSAAVNAGLATVRHPWMLSLNNDIRVDLDFLPPLLAATEEDALFAAVPRILLPSFGGRTESVMDARFEDGFISFVQPGLSERGPSFPEPRPVFFAVGGCGLYHTERLRELGGFDADYYPFYWEDIDLGYRAWRRGWTVRYVPSSVVYHRHRGTISRRYSGAEVRRALLKNQLLFHWKNLHDPAWLTEHLNGIALRILEEDARGARGFAEALLLALDDAQAMLQKRPAEAGFQGEVPIT